MRALSAAATPPSTPCRSMLSVLSLAAVLVLLGCRSDIQHGLSEAETNEIVTLLEAQGIAAEKSQDRGDDWVVSVPTDEGSRAGQILRANGLPRRAVRDFEETFGEPGLLSSPIENRVRLQQATAGELEETLMTLDGVLDARVHLVFDTQEGDPFHREGGVVTRSAAVLLVVRPSDREHARVDVGAVQRLVAGAAWGIAPGDVVVEMTARPAGEGASGPVTEWVRVGPVVVRADSAGLVRSLLGGLAGLVLLLSGALVWVLSRRRAVRRSQAQAQAQALELGGL